METAKTRGKPAAEEDDYELLEFFPGKDKSGRPCFFSFTPEELAKDPQLKTDATFRQAWIDTAPPECLQYPPAQ